MGTSEEPGLIPRTCEDLFGRIRKIASPGISFNVRVSYFEVYNEHVRDLLVPRHESQFNLRVRESPTDGPYVKNLTEYAVADYDQVKHYMDVGDKVQIDRFLATFY
jgi:hypothetical protein